MAIEPEYAAAYAGFAEALVTQTLAGPARVADVTPSALAAAKRAIELDPNSGEAYTALGAVDRSLLWDWNAAEENLRKGIALSPSNSQAEIWYALYLINVNRPTEAVEAMRRAVMLDPLSFWANRNLGIALYFARRYDESLAALERSYEIAPDNVVFVESWNSEVYEMQGRYHDAAAAYMKALAAENPPDQFDTLQSAFKAGGWIAYQKKELKSLLPLAKSPCSHWDDLALRYFKGGNLTEAFRWFNREVDQHCPDVIFLQADPRLDDIRADPRYSALLTG